MGTDRGAISSTSDALKYVTPGVAIPMQIGTDLYNFWGTRFTGEPGEKKSYMYPSGSLMQFFSTGSPLSPIRELSPLQGDTRIGIKGIRDPMDKVLTVQEPITTTKGYPGKR